MLGHSGNVEMTWPITGYGSVYIEGVEQCF